MTDLVASEPDPISREAYNAAFAALGLDPHEVVKVDPHEVVKVDLMTNRVTAYTRCLGWKECTDTAWPGQMHEHWKVWEVC